MKKPTVTIANGAAVSGVCALGSRPDLWPVGMVADAAWDTNAVSFQGSFDGANYFDVLDVDSGLEYSIAGVVKEKLLPLKFQNFLCCEYIKVRSGTSASPVNQSGATVVTLTLRDAG